MKNPFFLPALALAILTCPIVGRAQLPGSLDTSFDPGTGANNDVNSLAVQDDGKIIAAGAFTRFNGVAQSYITRLNVNGGADSSFNTGAGANAPVHAVAIKVNGQIMVGGAFTFFGGVAQYHVARLNANGSVDTAFNTGTGADNAMGDADVTSIVAQDDGKVVLAGAFTSFNGKACPGVVRLNANGSVDAAYQPPSSEAFDGAALLLQRDGKVVTVNPFVRLNLLDGSVDSTFNPNLNFSYKYFDCLGLQSDGSIVFGGYVHDSNSGQLVSYLGRVDTDGNSDASFGGVLDNFGGYSEVTALTVQANDAVIFASNSTYNSETDYGVFRLTANGEGDGAFDQNVGSNVNNDVGAVALQDDGKIIIAGAFTTFNKTTRNRIARLNGDNGPGELQFKTVTFRVMESQARVTLSVRRIGGGKGAVSVTYVTKDDTAKAGTDYKTTSGTLNWTDGDNAAKTILVPLLNAGVTDGGTRTFQVGLSLPTGGAMVGPLAAANVQILDNDSPKPVISSAATASGMIGQTFSYQIVASNNPTGYGVTGLPGGLAVNAKTGVISGTPTKAGKYTLTLKATNNGGSGTLALTLTIASGAPVITSAATATGTQDVPFSYQIMATNDPNYFAVVNQQPGLTLDHATGKITGTPTGTAGTYALTIKASNDKGAGQATLSLTIKVGKPVITSDGTASAKVGKAFSYQIMASHDPANYAVANQAPGLHLDNKTGVISGTPTKVGTYMLTLKAANGGGVGEKPLTLTVTK